MDNCGRNEGGQCKNFDIQTQESLRDNNNSKKDLYTIHIVNKNDYSLRAKELDKEISLSNKSSSNDNISIKNFSSNNRSRR